MAKVEASTFTRSNILVLREKILNVKHPTLSIPDTKVVFTALQAGTSILAPVVSIVEKAGVVSPQTAKEVVLWLAAGFATGEIGRESVDVVRYIGNRILNDTSNPSQS